MIVLDNTVVNVALPSIQADFHFSQSNLAWVVNAYMIAFGGALLLAGRLGDLAGSKRVFLWGIGVFTTASLACGLSWNADMLVVARFVQGLGGAMASAVVLAMIVTMFREPHERAKAMGVFSFTASAGGSVGLLVGGAIAQAINWHWVFLVNVPIGIAAFIIAAKVLENDDGMGFAEGADAAGAFLVTASLMLAVYAVVEIPDRGLTGAWTIGSAALSAVLFAGFIVREATTARPLLPLRILASRNLIGSNVIQVLVVAAMFGFFFLDSLYLRRVLGYTAVETGLAFLPVTVSIGALSLGWSARITTRFGPYAVVIGGLIMASFGLAILAVAPGDAPYLMTMFPSMLLLGIGLGGSFPSLMIFAMADATPENSGVTSGIVNTTSEVGGAFGLAVLATIASWKIGVLRAGGATEIAALSGAYRFTFSAATVCLIVAAVVAVTVLRDPSREELATKQD